jgi:hypothetical protein
LYEYVDRGKLEVFKKLNLRKEEILNYLMMVLIYENQLNRQFLETTESIIDNFARSFVRSFVCPSFECHSNWEEGTRLTIQNPRLPSHIPSQSHLSWKYGTKFVASVNLWLIKRKLKAENQQC